MSGGSFNYLCHSADEPWAKKDELHAMSDRLEELAESDPIYARAARDTRRILELLGEARRLGLGLEKVWHAVEWRDSSDCTEEDMLVEAVRYRKNHP